VITIQAKEELDPKSLQDCILALRNSGLIVYPTETFYALGIDPWNEPAVEKLYSLKARDEEKRLPVIAADTAMVSRFCDVRDSRFQKLAGRFWPGPLTIVLPLLRSLNTCAVRVSAHPIARQLCRAHGGFVVSTSVNKSGEPPLQHPNDLPAEFRKKIQILIDAGPCSAGKPSTILSLSEDPPKILRKGVISAEEIFAAL
jgi:L-threonylcarbamoyladenylate synthase